MHPTLYEGSSIVTLEAMAHRRAVVASRAGGLPDKVIPGVTGWLVPPGNEEALSAAIAKALARSVAAHLDGRSRPRACRERVLVARSDRSAARRSTRSCSPSEIRCRLQACFERSRDSLAPHSDAENPIGQSVDARSRAAAAVSAPGSGVVLDVGAKAAPYAAYVRAERYVRLDIDPAKQPDICCDLHELEWRGEPFDTVLAIEVLEHLYDPQRAIDRIHGVLKTGGICILSTRFMYRYHPDPQDHYRFTWDSLKYLFRNFRHVEVIHHGNRLQVIWEIINAGGRSRVVLNLLNPLVAQFSSSRTKFPLGFVVYAQK